MPLKETKAKQGSKAYQKVVSANIRELKSSKTKRPMKQIIAIALSSARAGKKK
jgi:hypothetical protein